jgi:hypothetical protein
VRVYISGPMSGKEDGNIAEFRRAATAVRWRGHSPQIPHDCAPWRHGGECPPGYVHNLDHTSACFLRGDLLWLLSNAEAVLMLRGWEYSIGARLEHDVASRCGLKIYYLTAGGVPLDLPMGQQS